MLVLQCNIEITGKDSKKITFDYVSAVEIVTSVKDLTDTARVTVPRKMRWREKPLTDFIKRGDKIAIRLGYENHALETVFTGYVKTFTTRTPVVLECENEMYLLKQVKVKPKKYAKFDFAQFMSEYAPDVAVL
jgi:hypothetical protein